MPPPSVAVVITGRSQTYGKLEPEMSLRAPHWPTRARGVARDEHGEARHPRRDLRAPRRRR